jgi:glycosyltransferase involved in cell wall biosynthesis
MKILHYHFGRDGGAEAFFVRLTAALAERGVAQKAVIRPDRRWKPEIESVAEVFAESHFRNTSYQRLWLPVQTGRLIRRWQPDAVLAWMSRAAHLLPPAAACHRLVRLGDYPEKLTQFKNADTIICNTPGIAQRVRSLGWRRGVEVVTNFTRSERVTPVTKRSVGTPDVAAVLCSAGRMVPRKGFDVLIRAVAALPHVHLWLLGDGQERSNLERLADALDVTGRVRFLGWQDDPRPFVAASDLFAAASSHEPLGNVILEAWAQQVPVISTKAEGPTWLIEHGQNGWLVDVGDDAGVARATRQLLADPMLARRIAEGGRRTLVERFSQQAIVDAYLKVLSGRPIATAA